MIATCQQKKNSAILIVLGLLLSGCFHNPKETALKNCTDSRYIDKYQYSSEGFFNSPLVNQKIKKKLKKEIAYGNVTAAHSNLVTAEKKMFAFSKNNFNLSKEETKNLLNSSREKKILEGFSDEVLEILGRKPVAKLIVRKIATGTDEQKNQFKEIIEEYNFLTQQYDLAEDFRGKLTTYLFLNMKMKDKFLEEEYQKLYQKCETVFNELPSSFILKWEHSTKLKEFL
tara:strand:- start:8 stop:691 length:684 start_codon:yes stop_codon:yes gene_type:complete